MALRKVKVDDKGYSAEYHRIIKYTYDVNNEKTHILVALYKDEAARQGDKVPCKQTLYDFTETEPSGRESCYDLLKTHSDFDDSEDC